MGVDEEKCVWTCAAETLLIMLKRIDEAEARILLGAVVQKNLAGHPKALPPIFGSFSLTKHSQVHLSRFISFGSRPVREKNENSSTWREAHPPSLRKF